MARQGLSQQRLLKQRLREGQQRAKRARSGGAPEGSSGGGGGGAFADGLERTSTGVNLLAAASPSPSLRRQGDGGTGAIGAFSTTGGSPPAASDGGGIPASSSLVSFRDFMEPSDGGDGGGVSLASTGRRIVKALVTGHGWWVLRDDLRCSPENCLRRSSLHPPFTSRSRYDNPCHSPGSDRSLIPRKPRGFHGLRRSSASTGGGSAVVGENAAGLLTSPLLGDPLESSTSVMTSMPTLGPTMSAQLAMDDAHEAAEDAAALLRAVLNLRVGAVVPPPPGAAAGTAPNAGDAAAGSGGGDGAKGKSARSALGKPPNSFWAGEDDPEAPHVGLSLGQQQLLCLARMLLLRRPVVLLDECTASIDATTSSVMRQVSRGLIECSVPIFLVLRRISDQRGEPNPPWNDDLIAGVGSPPSRVSNCASDCT